MRPLLWRGRGYGDPFGRCQDSSEEPQRSAGTYPIRSYRPEAGIEAAKDAGFDLAVSPPISSQNLEGGFGTLQAGDAERITNNLYRIPLRFRLKDLDREFSVNISIKVEELLPQKLKSPNLKQRKRKRRRRADWAP